MTADQCTNLAESYYDNKEVTFFNACKENVFCEAYKHHYQYGISEIIKRINRWHKRNADREILKQRELRKMFY